MAPPDRTALVVVDVQRAFEDAAYWGRRNNPACEANVARLIAAWREADAPIVFVRHDSDEEVSPLRPDHPGNAFKPEVTGEPDLLVSKQVNSAFHGEPDLAAWLRGEDLDGIAICGITTNHCCETTARVGANVGFDVLFVLDATHTFDREGPDGTVMTADELARATATSLHGEFAQVVDTADVIGSR
ncbi:MAG: cysteine hydrolase family protein [Solirubrobacteraceae bacterium]|jgi:nicotinamidase-related amidase